MKPGDKVVCVDDSPCGHCGGPPAVIKGNLYVVKQARQNPHYGNLGVSLIGITSCSPTGYLNAMRFRLLDELKQEAKQNQQKKATQPCS